ncbi:MAG: hypothetical protein U9R06_01760 [Patescibacteria group bacterium]|nr:hypothetical protein [Patescibacteria group bacterium]
MSLENPTVVPEAKGWRERIANEAKEIAIAKIKSTEAFDEDLKKKMIELANEIFEDGEYLKTYEAKWGQKLAGDMESDPEDIEKNLSKGLAAAVNNQIRQNLNLDSPKNLKR